MNSEVQFRIFTIVDLDKGKKNIYYEMHLKGWRYRTNRFGFSILNNCQPDDVMYSVWNTSFLERMR